MAHIEELGRRIELTSMDKHFHDISLALYKQPAPDGVSFLVHSYSTVGGTGDRVAFVTDAMKTLGGMVDSQSGGGRLRFACGSEHLLACKRIFIEACKLSSGDELAAPSLEEFDKKSDLTIVGRSSGDGVYTFSAVGEAENKDRRIGTLAGGLVKLAEMERVGDSIDQVKFSCGHDHDAMIGLLMGRALNVRAAMREMEEAASRGVLAAPSAQNN